MKTTNPPNNTVQIKAVLALLLVFLFTSIYWLYSQKERAPPQMTVEQKKERFKSLLVPAVDEVYADLMEQYEDVSHSLQNGNQSKKIDALKKEYKTTDNHELLMALMPHPKSITLAQAAMESSWATSRFFREANNVFGVWSFNENEPRIAAEKKRGDKTIWVKKYPSIKASIRDYYRTLARGDAYSDFRKLKMRTNDPFLLVKKLDNYSEKGTEYGRELGQIIRYNKFQTYDQQDITRQ